MPEELAEAASGEPFVVEDETGTVVGFGWLLGEDGRINMEVEFNAERYVKRLGP